MANNSEEETYGLLAQPLAFGVVYLQHLRGRRTCRGFGVHVEQRLQTQTAIPFARRALLLVAFCGAFSGRCARPAVFFPGCLQVFERVSVQPGHGPAFVSAAVSRQRTLAQRVARRLSQIHAPRVFGLARCVLLHSPLSERVRLRGGRVSGQKSQPCHRLCRELFHRCFFLVRRRAHHKSILRLFGVREPPLQRAQHSRRNEREKGWNG